MGASIQKPGWKNPESTFLIAEAPEKIRENTQKSSNFVKQLDTHANA